MSTAETLLAVSHAAQHTPRHATVIAHPAVARIAVIAALATLALVALGVITAEAHPGLPVAHAELNITMSVAVAFAAAQRHCRVSVAARLTLLAVASGRPILTLVADTWSLHARGMIVTAAVGPTVRSGPAKVAFALVIRCFAAISVDASLITGLGTILLAVAVEAALALTAEAAVSIGAECVGMAIVKAEIALVYVWTLRVRPAGLVRSQTAVPIFVDNRAAVDVGLIEITLHAHAGNGIIQTVAPAAAERV